MKQCFTSLACLTCLIFFSVSSFAQKPLFADDEVLQLTLTADWGEVQEDRGHNPKYHKAILSYVTPEGSQAEVELKVKARGNFRKDPFLCGFPPLRINFDKDDDIPAPFTGQNKLKMVTHCADDEFILREYHIYKMYQIFSEYSFLVRLAKIDYVDAKGELPTETHYSFFIEAEKDMATRLGGTRIDDDIHIESEDVTEQDLLRVHMFQYMIANMDFVVADRQNVKIITNPEMGGRPIVVPYDFDWSGLVDASYTFQTDESAYDARQKYKKLCLPQAAYEEMVLEFQSHQEEIWALYEDNPLLSEESVAYTLKNLKGFYKSLKKSKTIEEVFLKGCNTGE